jgi:AraC-like DNA-binding protein
MNYQTFAPPPSLKSYVREFWTLEDPTNDQKLKTFTVMCNGVPGLVFQENPEVFTGFAGERLPQCFVFGQARGFGQLQGSGPFRMIGVTFQPSALRTVFGMNAHDLTDQNTDLTNIVKTSLSEELLGCRPGQQQVSSLSAFLLEQARRRECEHKKLDYALDALQQGAKLPRVLQDLGLSERSLERLFLTYVGITPILYTRICRFQASLRLLRQGKARSLTDIAYTLGYFDQSHFIRDFKLFSGASPGIYQRNTVERMPGFPEWRS